MELLKTSSGHEGRIHRVLEFIDRRLDQSLDLQNLATAAHLSTFHFHRLFCAHMGETPGDYLRRRRLAVAASRLISQPQLSILYTALSVGFGSAEAFARAFKTNYGCTPTAWRAKHLNPVTHPGKSDRQLHFPRTILTENKIAIAPQTATPLGVKLVNRPPVTISYRRHVGPYGQNVIDFWQRELQPWLTTNDLQQQPYYGVSHDYPKTTRPTQCRYDGGAEVNNNFTPIGACFTTTIPGGLYATMGFKGTIEDFRGAWAQLLVHWLPFSGLQLDLRPRFEYFPYGSKYDPETGVFDCQLCLPVSRS